MRVKRGGGLCTDPDRPGPVSVQQSVHDDGDISNQNAGLDPLYPAE